MALMIGAFIVHGITPGPNVINDEPALFWGLIASMWIGNVLLVLLNLPLIGLWVRMLRIPYQVLFPMIILFAAIGTYSLSFNAYDVYAIAFFGILGYILIKCGCEPAPLLLGFVLGPAARGEPAARAHHLPRRRVGLPDPPDLRGAPGPGPRRARRRHPPDDSPAPGGRRSPGRSSNPNRVTVRSAKIVPRDERQHAPGLDQPHGLGGAVQRSAARVPAYRDRRRAGGVDRRGGRPRLGESARVVVRVGLEHLPLVPARRLERVARPAYLDQQRPDDALLPGRRVGAAPRVRHRRVAGAASPGVADPGRGRRHARADRDLPRDQRRADHRGGLGCGDGHGHGARARRAGRLRAALLGTAAGFPADRRRRRRCGGDRGAGHRVPAPSLADGAGRRGGDLRRGPARPGAGVCGSGRSTRCWGWRPGSPSRCPVSIRSRWAW